MRDMHSWTWLLHDFTRLGRGLLALYQVKLFFSFSFFLKKRGTKNNSKTVEVNGKNKFSIKILKTDLSFLT